MKISKKFPTVFAIFLLTFCAACVETVVVGTAATSVILMREKSADNTQKDVAIASKLGAQFIENGLKNPGNSIDITVNEGRVLLTGIVRDTKKSQLATDLAWKVANVKEVIDEVQVKDGKSLRPKDFVKSFTDYAISTEIESKLLLASEVESLNYKITTVNKVVYLIGVAQSKEELQKVLTSVAKVRGVEKVVNHVILVDDHRRSK